MAWSEKRPNGRYRGVYRDRQGRKRYLRGTYSHASEAERLAAIEEDKQRKPGAINIDGGRTPWGTWVDQWLDGWAAEPSTRQRAVSCIEQHIRPHWGAVPLDEIEPAAIKSWVKVLRKTHAKGTKKGEEPKPLAPRTINKIVTTFGTTLRGAVDERLIPASPSAGIKLETVTADDEYFMTRADVARFREVATEDSELLDLLIDIGTETGLRWGELAGLHLERVDTKRLVIQVQEVWDKHSSEIKPYPKGRRRRGVPFTKRLGGRLDDYVERNPPKRCRARHRGGGRCTGALLLASKVGTPLNYGNVRRRHWDSVAERAGLAGVTPHDMRHTYASWLIQDGAGIETVSALLGHKSWTTTMRYAHLADARWAQVRDIIGGPEPTPDELSSDAIAAAVRALAEAAPERWAAVAAALDGEQAPDAAPILPPFGGFTGGAKIIDLASRRRSAG